MCQCLICECWWCSWCDIACLGMSNMYCCFGCWCCKHDQIAAFDPYFCTCGQQSGFGGTCCCLGNVMCAPEWLKRYSVKKSSWHKSYN